MAGPSPYLFLTLFTAFSAIARNSIAQELLTRASLNKAPRAIDAEILTKAEWKQVESAIDRGLKYLSQQRQGNGAFQHDSINDPGVSGLCIMAFLSRGHLPGQGPYGSELTKSAEYLLNCQQSDGLISRHRHWKNSAYSHPICGLVLSEMYGISRFADESLFREVIEKGIGFTSRRYAQPKRHLFDHGSWRYLDHRNDRDGDLSITSWNVMFLRSAKNSGFDVDIQLIEDALAYMKRLYDPQHKTFHYVFEDPEIRGRGFHRAMAGAGVLSLSLAGEHHTELAQSAARFLLKNPYHDYDRPPNARELLGYGAFYSSVGMFQMGGDYWSEFYPTLAKSALKVQHPDGSWYSQSSREASYGATYMTALTILALSPPYQMLPIFQR